jgi:hypothetical protein
VNPFESAVASNNKYKGRVIWMCIRNGKFVLRNKLTERNISSHAHTHTHRLTHIHTHIHTITHRSEFRITLFIFQWWFQILSLFGTPATTALLCSIAWWWHEYRADSGIKLAGETGVLGDELSHFHFSHYKLIMTSPGMDPGLQGLLLTEWAVAQPTCTPLARDSFRST